MVSSDELCSMFALQDHHTKDKIVENYGKDAIFSFLFPSTTPYILPFYNALAHIYMFCSVMHQLCTYNLNISADCNAP